MTGFYTGECVGGPFDRRRQAHTSQTLEVALGPEFDFMDVGKEDFEIEAKVGRYVHDADKGQWIWHSPT